MRGKPLHLIVSAEEVDFEQIPFLECLGLPLARTRGKRCPEMLYERDCRGSGIAFWYGNSGCVGRGGGLFRCRVRRAVRAVIGADYLPFTEAELLRFAQTFETHARL